MPKDANTAGREMDDFDVGVASAQASTIVEQDRQIQRMQEHLRRLMSMAETLVAAQAQTERRLEKQDSRFDKLSDNIHEIALGVEKLAGNMQSYIDRSHDGDARISECHNRIDDTNTKIEDLCRWRSSLVGMARVGIYIWAFIQAAILLAVAHVWK